MKVAATEITHNKLSRFFCSH